MSTHENSEPVGQPSQKRRIWLWLGIASVSFAGLTGLLVTAVDRVRDTADRAD